MNMPTEMQEIVDTLMENALELPEMGKHSPVTREYVGFLLIICEGDVENAHAHAGASGQNDARALLSTLIIEFGEN